MPPPLRWSSQHWRPLLSGLLVYEHLPSHPWVDQHQPPQYWGAPRSASAVGLHSLTSSAGAWRDFPFLEDFHLSSQAGRWTKSRAGFGDFLSVELLHSPGLGKNLQWSFFWMSSRSWNLPELPQS